jgi:hypothetical protein
MSSTTAQEKTMSTTANDNSDDFEGESPAPAQKELNPYFGGCPTCHTTDGYLNAGRGHWFVCDEHQVMWYVGSNLFSSWQRETEEEQRAKWSRIENFEEVEPYHPPDDVARRQRVNEELQRELDQPRQASRVRALDDDIPW